jgi:hypothetical protein
VVYGNTTLPVAVAADFGWLLIVTVLPSFSFARMESPPAIYVCTQLYPLTFVQSFAARIRIPPCP